MFYQTDTTVGAKGCSSARSGYLSHMGLHCWPFGKVGTNKNNAMVGRSRQKPHMNVAAGEESDAGNVGRAGQGALTALGDPTQQGVDSGMWREQ